MEPSALDWVTLGIALAGFLLAVVSLVWQVFSWRLTGSVVRAELARGMTVGGSSGIDVIMLTARNIGRSSVSVTGWGLRVDEGGEISTLVVPVPLPWQGPTIPHTLEGGHSATWYFIEEELHPTLRKTPSPKRLRGRISLGTGTEALSKNTLKYEGGAFIAGEK